MTTDEAVAYVWDRLKAFGHRPELMHARESLRTVACAVPDSDAYTAAWEARSIEVIRKKKAIEQRHD